MRTTKAIVAPTYQRAYTEWRTQVTKNTADAGVTRRPFLVYDKETAQCCGGAEFFPEELTIVDHFDVDQYVLDFMLSRIRIPRPIRP